MDLVVTFWIYMRYTGNKRENRQIRLYQNLKLRIKENKKKTAHQRKI